MAAIGRMAMVLSGSRPFEFTRGVFVPPDPAARHVHVRFLFTPHRAVAARTTMMSDYGIAEPLTMVRAGA
jgi:hypothetical protein